MDVQMPVMDGSTATRKLREAGFAVPIVALTGHAMKGFETELNAAGFTAYATKPVDIGALLDTLAAMLRAEWRAVEDSSTAIMALPVLPASAVAANTPQSSPTEDGAEVVSRLAGNPRFHGAIRKFTDRLQAQLATMEDALTRADFSELARLGHWLKGAGGTVGYDDFTAPAGLLEEAALAADGAAASHVIGDLQLLAGRLAIPDGGPEPGPGSVPAPAAATSSKPGHSR
jgi:HPt (histidine-containing phosphotransfer) domain-containing protein